MKYGGQNLAAFEFNISRGDILASNAANDSLLGWGIAICCVGVALQSEAQ